MRRTQSNREYSDNTKTHTPFCSLICCRNKFGTHSGEVKRRTRRYHRHATKFDWRKEIESEAKIMEDILIICGFYEDCGDIMEYSAEYGNGY